VGKGRPQDLPAGGVRTPDSLTPRLGPRPVTGGSETVLVVETTERVRNVASRAAARRRLSRTSASSGEAALAVAGEDSGRSNCWSPTS